MHLHAKLNIIPGIYNDCFLITNKPHTNIHIQVILCCTSDADSIFERAAQTAK